MTKKCLLGIVEKILSEISSEFYISDYVYYENYGLSIPSARSPARPSVCRRYNSKTI